MLRRRPLLLAALAAVLVAALVAYLVWRPGRDGTDSASGADPSAAGAEPGAVRLDEGDLAALALRVPEPRQENFYFVMTDRFANGDRGNDTGGLSGDRLVTGHDPSDKGFFHGGDLAGLTEKLDYIEGLGTTAIWLTPSFVNRPVQGGGDEASAGYHGYWITDFTRIDPHLGTNAEMTALIDAAHERGMKVYFDIVTNHTADVIDYAEGEYGYIAKSDAPYTDADGREFDDAAVAGTPDFPDLAPTSFPYTPRFRTGADAAAKTPAWLNDPTLYHNRGNSTFSGESSTYGDFGGLDDLFTEDPDVVQGMIDIYTTWVDFGIDGFRIDTVKHVDLGFWQAFGPAIMDHARAQGKDDFFMFGEVYETAPAAMARYSTAGRLPATLDFGFQATAIEYAMGRPATRLSELFAGDDAYLDADSNAYSNPTFLGNHDMGRVASFLIGAAADDEDLLARDKLAMSLMYLSRGQPVTYYGDEQGFIGWGGDKDSRQDMFATQVEQYAGEKQVVGEPGARDRYDVDSPLYQHISALAGLREEHPALAGGIQIERYAAADEGIYAFSRIDRETAVEYLVAVNNAADEQRVSVPTASPGIEFSGLLDGPGGTAGDDGAIEVVVPGRGVAVLAAAAPIPAADAPPTLALTAGAGGPLTGSAQLTAELTSPSPAEVTFALRPAGGRDWTVLGTDDNPAYGLYVDADALDPGDYEVVAVARTLDGQVGYAGATASVGAPSGGELITVPGSHQQEAGCPGDWTPDCSATALTDPDGDGTWTLTLDGIPAGTYEAKVAVGGTWDENYGADGEADGANIPFTVAEGASVTFSYDAATHVLTVSSG